MFDRVTIEPDGDLLGRCDIHHVFNIRKKRSNATKLAMIAVAGSIAQVHYGDTPTVAVEESDEDWNDAEAYIEEDFGDTI